MNRDPAASHPGANLNRGLRNQDIGSLLLAAEAGCLRAQFLVGLAYHTGRGVEVDYERAAAWYHKAAGSGDRHAIANLGVMSVLGQGAPADDAEAYAWVQSAVGLGHEWLRPVLQFLEQRLTGSDRAGEGDCILSSISPETPEFRPCTQPVCDHSRCDID